jgi:hypothetical protein
LALSVTKALTVDEIFERVKNYDLVLTVDAPLADALNARLETPKLGIFAITPRRLAYHILDGVEEPLMDKRALFLDIIKRTGLNWKYAAYLLENIICCWEETGNPQEILNYREFNLPITKRVVNILKNSFNPYSAIEQYDISNDTKIAVVGLHQFTELDKKILPMEYEEIPVFSDTNTELPKFCIFNSVTDIIQTIIQSIQQNDLLDVAVVLEPGSSYRPLMEASLKTKGIPYMATTDFSTDEDLRTFLKILRFGLYGRGLQVRDVKPILAHFDAHVSTKHNIWQIDGINQPNVNQLKELLDVIPNSTFQQIIKVYEETIGRKQETLKEILDELDIFTSPITHGTLNSLEYYLDSFEIPMKRAGRGVMLASPKSSTYIDRPIIFFLGMDSSWIHETPNNPWIDKKSFAEGNKKNFQILLQNGERQYYLVQDTFMSKKVTPSFYFNEFYKQELESFTDLPHEYYDGPKTDRKKAFKKKDIGIEIQPVEALSQSDLNILAYCPKDYYFSQLVEGEDNHYLMRGRLLHDFAEFYVNHKDFVDSTGAEKFVDFMVDKIKPYFDDLEIDIERTKLMIGIENIKSYLQDYACEMQELEGYEKKYDTNLFSSHFNKTIELPLTEMYFYNPNIGGKGKVDLIRSSTHLVDYKTGRKKTVNMLMRKSHIDNIESRPDFQAKMYLAHHRHIYPDKKLKFTYYHLLDNLERVMSRESSY